MLTQPRLKELFSYNPKTGVLVRRDTLQKIRCLDGNGYVVTRIDGVLYKAHRLAFLYMKGYFPESQIDHMDRIKTNNKWSNLREVSAACNVRNRNVSAINTSGIKGVSWHKHRKKWRAQIRISGKAHHLGYFTCVIEASLHRLAAEQCLNWDGCKRG